MKVFTWFRPTTIEQVLLPLCDAFGRVVCRKPAASKPGNSEVSIIIGILFHSVAIIFHFISNL